MLMWRYICQCPVLSITLSPSGALWCIHTPGQACGTAGASCKTLNSELRGVRQRVPSSVQGHDEIVWAVEIHNQQLFSASADKTIRVWDIASKRCERVSAL